MIKKAQATLEFALVFIIAVALIAGLLNLWSWSKNQIEARQARYENTRVEAGTPPKSSVDVYESPKTFVADKIKDTDVYLFE